MTTADELLGRLVRLDRDELAKVLAARSEPAAAVAVLEEALAVFDALGSPEAAAVRKQLAAAAAASAGDTANTANTEATGAAPASEV